MNHLKLSISVIILLLSQSCKDDRSFIDTVKTETIVFSVEEALSGEVVVTEKSLLYGSVGIDLIDNDLIIHYRNQTFLYSISPVSSLENRTQLFSVGRGPNEFLSPLLLTQSDIKTGIVNFYDINRNTLIRVNLEETIKANWAIIVQQIKINGNYENPLILSDGNMLLRKRGEEKYSFSILDTINNETISNVILSKEIFEAQVLERLKEDRSKMMVFVASVDQIFIYDFKSRQFKSVSANNEFLLKDFSEGRRSNSFYYTDFQLTDNYLYLLYSNLPTDSIGILPDKQEIHIISWDGKGIARFYLDRDVISIAIDENNQIIYALTSEEEIIKYSFVCNTSDRRSHKISF